MEVTRKVTGDVLVSEDLANQIVEGLGKIVDAATAMGDAVLALTVRTPETPTPASDQGPAEPRVWDLTDDALANYDAEQLVALRADHRADQHDATDCHVCGVLVRRLGSL
jgi:hypothetical protein